MPKLIGKIFELAPWASDAGALYLRKVVTTILPFLLLPFISRVLDEVEFSKYLFFQSVFIFALLFTEFGFNLTAVRDLSRSDEPDEVKQKVTSVASAKIIVLLPVIAFIVAFPAIAGDPFFDGWTTCAVLFLAFSENLNPNWYLHGRGRIRASTALEIAIYLVTLIWVFAVLKLVQNAAAIFFGMGLIRLCLFSSFWMRFQRENGVLTVSIKLGWKELVSGTDVFLFRLASAFYNRGNTIVLSLLGTPIDIIQYSGAEKMAKGGGGLVSPISQAFFPRGARKVKDGMVKVDIQHLVYFFVGAAIMLSVSTTLFFLRYPLSSLLFAEYASSVSQTLAILAPLPTVIFVSNYFGIHVMLNSGAQREFSMIIVGASLFHAMIIVPAAMIGYANGVALAWLTTEFLVATLMVFFGSKRLVRAI